MTLSKISTDRSSFPQLATNRMSFCLGMLFAALLCQPIAMGQIPAPSIPDNGPSPSSPLGIAPAASSTGTNETISLSNGSVNLFIPLLSLTQRGGYPLTLGYVHHSNSKDFQQQIQISYTTDTSDGIPRAIDEPTYTDSHVSYDHVLEINLPRLQFSFEFLGDYTYYVGSVFNIVSNYCATNFQFTDWAGNKHPFGNITTCNTQYAPGEGSPHANLTDSSDGSFYQLDTSDPTDMKVFAKDGTVYHFYGYSNPFPPGDGGSGFGGNQENYYDRRSGLIVDPNGNRLSIQTTNEPYDNGYQYLYTVTDTLGRTITISTSSGVSYIDSNGAQQQIAFTLTHSSQTTDVTLLFSCSYIGGNTGYPQLPTANTVNTLTGIPASSEATITFPAGNGGGQRVYTLNFDALDRISKIQYPSGGYTRYDYNDGIEAANTVLREPANVQCTDNLAEVAHKYECRSATGSCSSEDRTIYAAVISSSGQPFNASMTITDALGQKETHLFSTTSRVRTNPQETDVLTYNSSGTLVRTVHKDYPSIAPPGAGQYSYDITFPSMITTTLNDGSPAISTVAQYTYAPYTVYLPYPEDVLIDNPTEIDTTDYGGGTLSKVSETWEPASAFTTSNHILDRLHTKTTTDPSTGNFITTTNGYDAAGNITSVAVNGTANGSASGPFTTLYPRNGYGEIYQITDPKSNTTTIGYGDAWSDAAQTCVPANSSAYPTSVTNALGQITKYTYNACTGTIASVADPNNAVTGFSYDPQGRVTAETLKDSNHALESSKTAVFQDSAPETLTTQVFLDSQRSVNTEIDLDGLGRNSRTILTSDGGGSDYTDTTYDEVGRKQSVSTPYRMGQSGHGYTSYQYDALGRPLFQCQPDNTSAPSTTCTPTNSYLKWLYSGNVTDSFDETRRHWQRTEDALGRLTKVLEPDPASGTPSLETDYSYDASGNLLQVKQWGGPVNSPGERLRTFQYDGVNRLIHACNPEGLPQGISACSTSGPWSMQYSYDADGNVHTMTDGNNVITTNNYDALNRIISRTFAGGSNPTPSETFDYDTSSINGLGRLSDEFTGSRTHPYSWKAVSVYDARGHVITERQCALQNCPTGGETLQYGYDLMGNLTSTSNGISSNPITITSAYDTANRLMSVVSSYSGIAGSPQTFDSSHPDELFSAEAPGAYGPFGLVNPGYAKVTSSGVTSINRQLMYDARMRVVSDSYTSPNVQTPPTPSTAMITIHPLNASNDTDQSTQVNGPATAGEGSALVSGVEKSYQICQPSGTSCRIAWDSGTVSVAVGGYTVTANYSSGVTLSQIEQSLLSGLNAASSPVTATLAGNQFNLVSKSTGAASNLTLSWSGTVNEGGCSKGCHSTSDFALQLSGSTLTGGTPAGLRTVYDSGSLSATINSTTATVPFDQSSTAESIASGLATAIENVVGTTVTAMPLGNSVQLTTIATGPSSNFSLSVSDTFDSTDFAISSFTPAVSSQTPGLAPMPGGTLYGYSITKSDGSAGYDLNGNVIGFNDSVMGQWAATYDQLNRIRNANVTSGTYNGMTLAWSIDPFGNRATQIPTGHLPPQNTPGLSFNNLKNQADQLIYDSAGNVINDASNGYLYDAENRICAVQQAGGSTFGYLYDAEGHRVAKGSLSSKSCDLSNNGFTANEVYVMGPSGEQVTELNSAGWVHTNVFADGKLLGTYDPYGLHFALSDWLGTKRVQVSPMGTNEETCLSLPFGDSQACTGTGMDATEHHFTGKERDTGSNLDFFAARYYGSSTGRFTSPDWNDGPITVPYAELENPQSLNLYAFADNNPLTRVDPTGHSSDWHSLGGKTLMRVDTASADQVNVHVKVKNVEFRGRLDPDSKTILWGKSGSPPKQIATDVQAYLMQRGKYDIAAAKKGMSILGGGRDGEAGSSKLGEATNSALIISMLFDTITQSYQMSQINKLEGSTGFHLAIDSSIVVSNLSKFGDYAGPGAQVSFDGGVFTLQSNGSWADPWGNQLTQDQNGFHITTPLI